MSLKAELIAGLITFLVGIIIISHDNRALVNHLLSRLKLAPDGAIPRELREDLSAVRSWESPPRLEKVG